MTNKEFRDILAQYPDDYTIQLDKSYGWETPSNKNLCDPHLYINTDFGFIEIEPDEYHEPWVKCTLKMPEEKPLEPHSRLKVSDYVLIKLANNFITTDRLFNGAWEYHSQDRVIAWMKIPE